jgi:hypothetical protein
MQELDPRIVRVGIEVNGIVKFYEGLNVKASGSKFTNANQNECQIQISNLDKQTRDFILTETSPFNQNRSPKRVIVEAGRLSYGTQQIFIGDISSSSPSQPPDITITLKCLTGNFKKGDVIARNQPGQARLKVVSEQVAKDLELALSFQAKDKNISNYVYTGGALKQVEKLGELGRVNAYVDDNRLVVKDYNVPLSNRVTILNLDTGMIGIPEITEQGVKVKYLLDANTTLGGTLRISSIIYPAVNGDYCIYKLNFEIASRDTPFYWIAEAKRL